MRHGNAFGCFCLCTCLYLMLHLLKASTQKVHFWYTGTSSESSGEDRISRSLGQGQGHRRKNAFVGGRPSTERQSCSYEGSVQLRISSSVFSVCVFSLGGCENFCLSVNELPGNSLLWNDTLCVKWDTKLYSLTQSHRKSLDYLSINIGIMLHEALNGLLETPGSRQV